MVKPIKVNPEQWCCPAGHLCPTGVEKTCTLKNYGMCSSRPYTPEIVSHKSLDLIWPSEGFKLSKDSLHARMEKLGLKVGSRTEENASAMAYIFNSAIVASRLSPHLLGIICEKSGDVNWAYVTKDLPAPSTFISKDLAIQMLNDR